MRTLIAGLGVTAALIFAPTANATPEEYLSDLAWAGFEGPAQQAVNLGYGICRALDAGYSRASIINTVVENTGSGIYTDQAQYMVESAELYLCSQPEAM